MVHENLDRRKDFYRKLKRIEYQAERVATNPNISTNTEAARHHLQMKSSQLMNSIIQFFNAYLLHFNKNLFSNHDSLYC